MSDDRFEPARQGRHDGLDKLGVAKATLFGDKLGGECGDLAIETNTCAVCARRTWPRSAPSRLLAPLRRRW
jgi:hypothetical protein